jgi:phosphatidylserine/phosphatidylglycerophosphate/cardiolipin synthase-like enzyme
MSSPVTITFLRDDQRGGSPGQLQQVADQLAAFVAAATTSVDVAIYDFRLTDPGAAATVVGALTEAAQRGVTVRIGFDAGNKPTGADPAAFVALGADPAPVGTRDWVNQHFAGTAVQLAPIAGHGHLMHSKYVLRDAAAAAPTTAIWTGSANFTDDAWTRQENNIVTIPSPAMAASYREDFDTMWAAQSITGAGEGDAGNATLADQSRVTWDFCPGDGVAVNRALARRVSAATTRITVASMVLTSHEVLSALAAAISSGVPVNGIYDGGQMDPIVEGWREHPGSAQVLADWGTVSPLLARKDSIPYSPTSIHNFMHLKVLLSDDLVTTGSYNFSGNAERNAENQITLNAPDTVAAYADYLAGVIAAYGATAPA